MTTTPLTPAGERILDVASELFYTRGIGAVGVELVAESAGVTKKTLYDRFGSKAQLVEAYLRARDTRWRAFLTSYVDTYGGTPRENLLTMFDGVGEWMRRHNPHPRGCGFVNASAELTDPYHPGRQAVAEQKEWVRQYFQQLTDAAALPQPEFTARQLMLLFEGACVAHGLGLDDNPAAVAREAAADLIDNTAGRGNS